MSTNKELDDRITKEMETRKKFGIEKMSDMYKPISDSEHNHAIRVMGQKWENAAKKRKLQGGRTKRKRTYKKKNKLCKKTRRHY